MSFLEALFEALSAGGTEALTYVAAHALTGQNLYLHNTLTKELEPFRPLGKKVLMYNCGPTVYDFATIGNLRSYIFADTLRRTLDIFGYEVKQVINITDFGHLTSDADEGEDKMTKGLRREGLELTMQNMHTLAGRYMEAFLRDIEAIGVNTKTITFPRASDYIPQQIALIERLEKKGFAYQTESGVYFDTAQFPEYGKLGSINLSGQQAGMRVEASGKKNPQDFVLWKPDAKLGWESPWGMGFPGWHTECVAMIFALLGEHIDIHTGGIDHIPVHHNNEIAQAEAAAGGQFVQYWMHNEFITIDQNRVGKSQGNAIVLQEVKDKGLDPRALRYWYLTGHYRTPMNFTWEALEGAATALKRLQQAYTSLPKGEIDHKFLESFFEAIGNDLDTPKALALIWENIKVLNQTTLAEADKVLGLGLADRKVKPSDIPVEIKKLAEERESARMAKDFARSDELRKKIEEAGYEVKDTDSGPKLSKK